MATFFNKTTKDLLQHVRVQGVAPPQETADVATAYAERTLEEQTAMLQRQLERLKVQNRLRLAQQPGSQGAQQAANGDEDEGDDDVSSGENSEDDDELVRQESDHPPAPLDDDDDNDDNDNVGAETTAATGDGNLPVQKGPVLYFQAGKESANTWCSIYRDVLPSRGVDVGTHVVEEEIRSLPTAGPWAFFMLAGGHFAGAIVNRGQIQHHKCFHRYVVRAKRGTVQSVRDAKSGTSQPKSAGSNLRRYNEQQLRQDIEGLLREWKPYLASCTVIFHRTSVHNRSFIFQSAKQQKKTGTSDESDLLVRNDPRIRTVPFPTQRPTLKEIARVYALLTCINVLDGEPAFIRKHREQTEQSKTTGDAAQQQQHKEEQRKQREENDAEKKHAGAQQSAVVASTQTILYKACLKGDIGKLRRMLNADNDDETYHTVVSTINHTCGRQLETALHAASRKGFADIVALLLEHGADPTIKNAKRKTPYAATKSTDVRDSFRRFRYTAPDMFDYKLAQIPSALTPEMEQKRQEKKEAAAKKDAERRRAQEQKREEQALKEERKLAEKPQQPKMSAAGRARQLRAEAALKRMKQQNPEAVSEDHCAYCLKDLSNAGNDFFKRLDFKYCSMHCLKTHRLALESRT